MRRQTFSMGIDPITRSTPEQVDLADGSAAWVVDTGPDDGIPVLFVGGSATSATVVDLVSFLASAREELGIRLISVERNGFGDTPFDPDGGYGDFARTAVGVLDAKGVDRFSIVAISGGGPYAQKVAVAVPDRLRSVHFAAAYTGTPDAGPPKDLCRLEPQGRAGLAQGFSDDPAAWWAFGEDAIAHRIPGFVAAAVADAERALRDRRRDAPAADEHDSRPGDGRRSRRAPPRLRGRAGCLADGGRAPGRRAEQHQG